MIGALVSGGRGGKTSDSAVERLSVGVRVGVILAETLARRRRSASEDSDDMVRVDAR